MIKLHKFLTVISLVLPLCLTSCGDKSSKGGDVEDSVVPDQVWHLGVGQFNGIVNFGNLNSKKNYITTIKVINVGDSVLSGPASVSGDGFSLAYSNCSSIAVDKTCILKIVFSSSNKPNGLYTGKILLGNSEGDLSAAVDLPPIVENIAISSGGIAVTDTVDFGVIKYSQNIIKTLKIENNSSDSLPIAPVVVNNFSISHDSCSGKTIKTKGSCQIKFALTGAGKSGSVSDVISIGQRTVTLTGNVKNLAVISAEESDIKLLINNQPFAPGIGDLGTWNLTNNKMINVYLKNMGSSTGLLSTSNLVDGGVELYNSCADQSTLAAGDSCIIKIATSLPNKGTFSLNFLANDQEYNLQYVARSPGDKIYCDMDNAQESYITWNGTNYSQCNIELCNSTYHLVGNSCATNTESCLINNGSGERNWIDGGWEQCQVQSCDDDFTEVNNLCVPSSDFYLVVRGKGTLTGTVNGQNVSLSNSQVTGDTSSTVPGIPIGSLVNLTATPESSYHFVNWEVDRTGTNNPISFSTVAYMAVRALFAPNVITCTVPNGTGTQTWNGSSYNDCVVGACSLNYTLQNNVCNPNVIACNILNGTGSQTWTGTEFGTCTVTSCSGTHHINGNACDANVIACNIPDGSGTQTWNGVSAYGNCTVSSCQPTHHIQGNTCAANVVACNITNGTGTQTWGTTSYGTCTVATCGTGYFKDTASNSCKIIDSCKNLLAYRPELQNQDGMYQLMSDTGVAFNAYCDMTSENGGWTLLFSPDSTNVYTENQGYNSPHAIFSGNDTRTISKNVLGATTTIAEQQKSVKHVKFTQLKMYGRGLTSAQNTSFATKFANRTAWDYTTTISGLTKCTASSLNKWDMVTYGSHTENRAVLSCYESTAYGDSIFVSLGGYSARTSANTCGRDGQGGTSGGSDTAGSLFYCARWYLLVSHGHRGGNVINDSNNKTHMIWGR